MITSKFTQGITRKLMLGGVAILTGIGAFSLYKLLAISEMEEATYKLQKELKSQKFYGEEAQPDLLQATVSFILPYAYFFTYPPLEKSPPEFEKRS